MRLYLLQSLKLGTRSFVRNGTLVLLTIVAVVGIQLVFLAGLMGKTVFNYGLSALDKRVDVRLALVTSAKDVSITQLAEYISAMPHVSSVKRESADVLYDSFQERHATDYLTLQALKELPGNPFGDELIIKLDQAGYYSQFFNELQKADGLDPELLALIEDTDTIHNDELVRRLAQFQNTASTIGWVAIGGAMALIVLIMSVVSRLFLSQYAQDVKIMRMFGVSESHIGGWLSVTYSLCIIVATVITVLAASAAVSAFDVYMAKLAAGLSLSAWFQANLIGIIGFVFFVSMAIVNFITFAYLQLHQSDKK